MQVSVYAHQPQQQTCLQSLLAETNAAALGSDMRVAEGEHDMHLAMQLTRADDRETSNKSQPQSFAEMHEQTAQALARQHAGKSPKEIRKAFPSPLGERVIAIVQSQAPTFRQALMKREQAVLAANAEFGKALQAMGVQIQQHSLDDFTHVIRTQLNQWALGNAPSVSEVLRIAFPDAPTKAKSIRGSTRVKRWKEAYNSDAVGNHPVEIAMRLTHDKGCINGRHTARNFGQSLSINMTLLKSCDRFNKQGAEIDQLKARVKLLEEQMQATKQREALADAGATTSEEKVFALYRQGKMRTEIAKLLDMKVDAVKYHLKKLPKRAKSTGG